MNDGEKELMKLWNLHLMKNRLVNFYFCFVSVSSFKYVMKIAILLITSPQKVQ